MITGLIFLIIGLAVLLLAFLAVIQYMLLYAYWSNRTAAINARVRDDEHAEQEYLRRAFRVRRWTWPTRVIEPAERAHDRQLRSEQH